MAKKSFNYWLLIIATIYSAIVFFSNTFSKNRRLDDILNQQMLSPWLPTIDLGYDIIKLFLIYIFCVSLYLAFQKYKEQNFNNLFIFILIAIIFNPFSAFSFSYETHKILIFGLVLFFGYLTYKEYKML